MSLHALYHSEKLNDRKSLCACKSQLRDQEYQFVLSTLWISSDRVNFDDIKTSHLKPNLNESCIV